MKTVTSFSQLLEWVADLSTCTIIDVTADGCQYLAQQGEPIVVAPSVLEPTPTREDVAGLKRRWESDPDWHIEETEGFELFKDELKAFSDERHALWRKQLDDSYVALRRSMAARLGLDADHHAVTYTLGLEGRLADIERRLGEVENRTDWRRS